MSKTKESNSQQETQTLNEKITIELPKEIVNYYKLLEQTQGIKVESLIAFDVANNLNAIFGGRTPEEWKDFFNLGKALEMVAGREELMKRKF